MDTTLTRVPTREDMFQNEGMKYEVFASHQAFNSIVNTAMGTTYPSVMTYITVPENSRPLLERMLLESGFGKIHYHDNYVIVENNPHRFSNVAELGRVYMEVIASRMVTAPRCGNEIRVQLVVPTCARNWIKVEMSPLGWHVDYVDDPKNGCYVALR